MDNVGLDADILARNWLSVVLRGAAALLFGLLTLFLPGFSLLALVFAFAGYALADGVLAILSAVRQRHSEPRWVYLLEGVFGLAVAVLTFLWPGLTLLSLLYVIAARALVAGVLQILAALRLRKVITTEWLMATSGALSIAIALLIVLSPGVGLLTMALWIGAYALLFGGAFLALGLRLRVWDRQRKESAGGATASLGAHPVGGMANG
jgi:uncharacterized membrane protein HdeD (DUF308 family)